MRTVCAARLLWYACKCHMILFSEYILYSCLFHRFQSFHPQSIYLYPLVLQTLLRKQWARQFVQKGETLAVTSRLAVKAHQHVHDLQIGPFYRRFRLVMIPQWLTDPIFQGVAPSCHGSFLARKSCACSRTRTPDMELRFWCGSAGKRAVLGARVLGVTRLLGIHPKLVDINIQ
jgi:hypothetical protein